MLEMFAIVPPSKPPPTPTTIEPTAEGHPQTKVDTKRGPTTITTAPEAVPVSTTLTGMVYVSMTSIQAMVQRKARTES